MAESSFAVLNHIGVLPVDESSEIRFSIDAYRGYRYASIRKYLTSGDYIGATRAMPIRIGSNMNGLMGSAATCLRALKSG